ncbi:MAG: ATP-binding cassette domain-containing protein [Myxococcales bacterium]|nr:MAG: ATP-binding cassette domain-containing protein [Myxococcales bacterium]
MTPRSRLYGYLRPYLWPHFAVALLCMVLYSATSGIVPYLVRTVVDDVLISADASGLAAVTLLVLVVFVARGLLGFGQAYLSEYVGQYIVYDLRRELNDKIQHLPASYLDRASTGSLLSRVTTDVLALRQALIEGAAALLRDATTVFVLIGVAFWLDPMLAVVAFVVFPAIVVPLQNLSRRMRRFSREGLETLGNLSALLQEAIVGNRVVKAFGMESYEKDRFDAESRSLVRTYLRAARIKAFTTPMVETAAALAVAAVLWIGADSVLDGRRSAGSLLAFLTALSLIYEPFKKIVRTNNVVQTGLGAAARIFELLDVSVEDDSGGDIVIDGFRRAIVFEDVTFAYGEESVLEAACVEILAGQIVALVGPSGAGKSTIADLIPRFYEPCSGRITIDGEPLERIRLDSLRAQIAVVTQFTFLFNDTVRNNIAYGREGLDSALVEDAARAAGAHDFILDLPQGYDTVVGELGLKLSGGQRQRIVIARALLKDAPILILDEATSGLDAESERHVQRAVTRLMQGRTTIVIAHRLSTVQRADRIVVVDGGRIVEMGTHTELMTAAGLYRRLYEIQFDERATGGMGHEARA